MAQATIDRPGDLDRSHLLICSDLRIGEASARRRACLNRSNWTPRSAAGVKTLARVRAKMTHVATEYRVYDPQKNEFLRTQASEQEAITGAEEIANIDQFEGRL
jgi:hypothetical protein